MGVYSESHEFDNIRVRVRGFWHRKSLQDILRQSYSKKSQSQKNLTQEESVGAVRVGEIKNKKGILGVVGTAGIWQNKS
jgi:hypothetical protein